MDKKLLIRLEQIKKDYCRVLLIQPDEYKKMYLYIEKTEQELVSA